MADPLRDIVKRMVDAGESEANIALVIQRMSHDEPAPAPLVSTGGGRGTGLDVRKSNQWAKDNAGAIGASLAVAAGPAGVIASPLLAMGGGVGGGLLRGDSAGEATVEGIKQGGYQVAGNAVGAGANIIARGLMKGTVPKGIAKDFQGQVDIPKEMLDRGVFPGVPASARRVTGLSKAANVEREAAASTVPPMPRSKVIEGLRPVHREAVRGREPDLAQATLEHMRKSARDIGPTPMDGPDALIRKDIKQRVGDSAINNPNAPFGKQLQDAERGAIVSHLRETPRMATALDESQTLMAIDQVMKDAQLGNPITRMRIGGPTAVALTPAGFGATAHAVNQGGKLASKAMNPNVLRLLDMIMTQGSHQQ
jgi:hypothetical protein